MWLHALESCTVPQTECRVESSLDEAKLQTCIDSLVIVQTYAFTKNAKCMVVECTVLVLRTYSIIIQYSAWGGLIRALVSVFSCGALFTTSD